MERDVALVKAAIVSKLVRWNKWGGAHTENILSGIPRHLRGTKEAKHALKELVQSGWLIVAVKTKELHYSLNPEKAAEILTFYGEQSKE